MRVATDLDTNIRRIVSHIKEASLQRISLLCFPECSLSGYIVNHAKINYETITESVQKLQYASNKFQVALLIGTPWKSRGKIFNSALIIKPKSGNIRKYYKSDLTEYDRKYFSRGNSSICPFWVHHHVQCGVLICRDQNSPMLALRYKKNNVKVLFYMSSHHYTKQEALDKERRNRSFPIVRAAENMMYVAKADAVGEQNGLISLGCSMIVNPEGKVIDEAKKGEEKLLKFSL